jgi:hypothetical protein
MDGDVIVTNKRKLVVLRREGRGMSVIKRNVYI